MMAGRVTGRKADNVRIGPVSVITLIAVICMAVLAVLSISTAQATGAISSRQASATSELYENELAAQTFLAGVDDQVSAARAGGAGGEQAAAQVRAALDGICDQARAAADDNVHVTATVEGDVVNATFEGQAMRRLVVAVKILDDATCRVTTWKASAIQQETAETDTLWTGE